MTIFCLIKVVMDHGKAENLVIGHELRYRDGGWAILCTSKIRNWEYPDPLHHAPYMVFSE